MNAGAIIESEMPVRAVLAALTIFPAYSASVYFAKSAVSD